MPMDRHVASLLAMTSPRQRIAIWSAFRQVGIVIARSHRALEERPSFDAGYGDEAIQRTKALYDPWIASLRSQ
jgi:hypothetical protein